MFYNLGTPVHREIAQHMTFRPLDLVLVALVVLAMLVLGLVEVSTSADGRVLSIKEPS